MLRRLMLVALALCAFLALEGCGTSRLVAPQVATTQGTENDKQPILGRNQPVTPTAPPVGPRPERTPTDDGGGPQP
jgi:hypothetical protein